MARRHASTRQLVALPSHALLRSSRNHSYATADDPPKSFVCAPCLTATRQPMRDAPKIDFFLSRVLRAHHPVRTRHSSCRTSMSWSATSRSPLHDPTHLCRPKTLQGHPVGDPAMVARRTWPPQEDKLSAHCSTSRIKMASLNHDDAY